MKLTIYQTFIFIYILILLLMRFVLLKKRWLLICLLSISQFSQSQTRAYFTNIKTFNETNGFDIAEGVSSIYQDHKGFIWISSRSGLYRFNGTSFKLFKHDPSDTNSLPSNSVNFCYQDKEGDYWLSVYGKGLFRFDERTEKFSAWINKNKEEIDLSTVQNLIAPFEDSHGQLWISATTRGIVRINKKDNTVKLFNVCDHYNASDLYRSCMWVHHFAEDPDGTFWLSSNDGIIHFDPAEGSFKVFRNGAESTGYLKDSEGNRWITTWGEGLKKFDPVTGTWTRYLLQKEITGGTNNIVSGIAEKDKDHLWISSIDKGLLIFDKATGNFMPVMALTRNEDYSGEVSALFPDRDGNIWIVGEQKLGRFSSENTFHYESIGSSPNGIAKDVSCFLRLPGDSVILVGNVYTPEGLQAYDLKNRSMHIIKLGSGNGTDDVHDIFQDSNKQIWIATGHGIYKLDRRSLTSKKFQPASNIFRNYFDGSFIKIAEDRTHQQLWFATHRQGLLRYEIETGSIIRYSSDSSGIHNIPIDQIETAAFDRDNNLWIGTHAYLTGQPTAFCIKNNGELVSYEKKIASDAAALISELHDGSIAVATDKTGLYLINNPLKPNESISRYTEEHGITNLFLEGFTEDKKGNIWISTHNGLSCLTPKGIINFHNSDGLSENFIHSHPYSDENNNIFLAFANGFQYFNADSLLGSHYPIGPVILESFTINQKPFNIDPSHRLHLDYDENNLSIEFAAFDLSQGEDLQYAYQLQGSDTGWSYLGKNRQLFFSRLSPGHYKLRVRAGDRFGNWGQKELLLPFVIDPPFWRTWWFYLLCIIATIALAYIIYKLRINTVLKEQKLRNKIARDLHDDIGSTLSGIKLFSNIAQSKLMQEKSEAVPILEKISQRSENMIEAMSDIVWSINPVNDSPENMIVKMKQYATEMLEPKNISYQINAAEKLSRMKIGIESRKDIYLIYKEAINNAVKYSQCKNIIIDLQLKNKIFIMSVHDDGIGFDIQNANGNGLQNFRARAKNIGGNVQVSSKKGEGTTIFLELTLT